MTEVSRVANMLQAFHRLPQVVRAADRAWRAKERASNVKPVSTKIAFYSPKVDAVAAVKPRGRGK